MPLIASDVILIAIFSSDLKMFAVRKDAQVKKLKGDKSRLEAEVDELEKKVERMSTMQKQVSILGGKKGKCADDGPLLVGFSVE